MFSLKNKKKSENYPYSPAYLEITGDNQFRLTYWCSVTCMKNMGALSFCQYCPKIVTSFKTSAGYEYSWLL